MVAGVQRAAADQIRAAAAAVMGEIDADPRYAHTTHLQIRVRGALVVDEHRHGPVVADVFSITKSVLATVLAHLAHQRRQPALHRPVSQVLPALRGTPAESHTWRQLLTMTRGARTDDRWDIDVVTALPEGQVQRIAEAPQLHPPGERFGYDGGAAHLLSAALSEIVSEPVADYAARHLFPMIGVEPGPWRADPDGYSYGFAHLELSADDLGQLGQLWLDAGRLNGEPLLDPQFLGEMTSPQSAGGPPENLPYGYLVWVDRGSLLAGGWAGQHLLVVPDARAVIVTTGDPKFDFGPRPSDQLPKNWAPALDLIRQHLLPVLKDGE
jgi:CubicO group peptidase (beta-lactamase class C family)